MEILEQLEDLTTVELVELQRNITKILQERDEDVIKSVVEYLYKVQHDSIRYTDLTLHLEGLVLRREAIARVLVNMWKKNAHIAHGGCPIWEEDLLIIIIDEMV